MRKPWLILACVAWLLGPAAAASQVTLRVKGADAMVHLAEAWADKFMLIHPDLTIVVNGGGLKSGLEGLRNGSVDIADAARPLDPAEVQAAKTSGYALVERVVALDAITVIVNRSAPVYALTLPQVKQIFTGQVMNWKLVGGPDRAIRLYIRNAGSDSFVFFQKRILQKEAYAAQAKCLGSNSAIIQAVNDDRASIGYVGLSSYASAQLEVRALRIHTDDRSPDSTPNLDTVTAGSYPISHRLRMITRGQAAGPAKEFIDFAAGELGQDIVEHQGCIKLPKRP